ncbi:biotin biosynthesis protein BioY [Roseospira marina]|uniref:Biotin transporter n=1 Tax=Roseospira marina TaxID=140057 RepID=A0A5M6ICX5_9PROT|nr:biotin transporter BioY [Roseospira marina]KAA5606124.1 biotin biosynthesis protein BioY [Roseospira marina]MBB4314262.1 biotin transport system substrate-specific component [Roseospira marina]MBB5087422.1 biotin transport system substrate-specific component [Roseospira marina]
MKHTVVRTKDIVLIALFAALMAALALFPPITIPALGVPITAQSMGVMLSGAILGAKRGGLSILLFLLLVAIGLPLLSGGRGGLGVFFGPTAGFMFGWVLGAVLIGYLHERAWATIEPFKSFLYCFLGGIVVVYAIGIPWASVNTGVSLVKVAVGSLAFIPGDMLKAGLTALAVVAIRKAFPAMHQPAA